MYVVLVKGERKVLVLKEETAGRQKYRHYRVYKKSGNWKQCEAWMRQIKRGEIKVPHESKDKMPQASPSAARLEPVRWEVEFLPYKHYVYGLYDSDDKLLYIGVTSNPNNRVKEHRKDKKKFHHMEVIFSFNSREEADSFERFAIFNLNPPLNILVEGLTKDWIHDLTSLDSFGNLSKVKKRKKIYEIPVRKK